MNAFDLFSAINNTSLVYGLLLVLTLAASEYRRDATRKRKLLVASMLFHMLTMLAQVASWMLVRRPGHLVHILLVTCLTAADVLSVVTCLLIMMYVYTDASGYVRKPRGVDWLVLVLWVLNGVSMVLSLSNPWTHVYNSISEANAYAVGPLYWLRHVFGLLQALLLLPVIVHLRAHMTHGMTVRLVVCGLLTAIATVAELMVPGVMLMPSAVSLVLVLLSSGVQSRLESDLAEARAEAAESRVRLLSGQINRHFVFNSLTAIKELVAEDPALAEATIQDFSDYLRSHLDVLADTRLVPFSDELEHVRHYVALEQADCVNPLEVRYELGTTDFEVPPLTVQPLVENAIRHGIRTRAEGGTVVISTAERPDAIEVRVSDDGHGMSSATARQDERKRIGVANVRERIARQCGGGLEIESMPTGTVAILTIPRRVSP